MPATVMYFRGHTYEINLDTNGWDSAANFAEQNGGYLAIITSTAENTAILDLAKAHYNPAEGIYVAPDGGSGSYVWIGGTDAAREGTWRWADGTAMSGYTNWGSGNGVLEPDNYRGIQDHLGLSLDGWPSPSSSIGSAGEWNDISGSNGLWSIIEFDGLIGSSANDRIVGSSLSEYFFGAKGDDTLIGMGGNDRMVGSDGRDSLSGGDGADRLTGGRGMDNLRGGTGADVFIFDDYDTAKGTTRDVIEGFARGTDDINLRAVDSYRGVTGDQNFTFSGTTATANAVWFKAVSGGIILSGDCNGDRVADFEIRLNGIAGLSAGDIIV